MDISVCSEHQVKDPSCNRCYPVSPQEDWRNNLKQWIDHQHGTAGWQMKLENLIEEILLSHEQKRNADLKRKIEKMRYMYEHQKPGAEGDIFCETCREAVKVDSPCKESRYYVVWQALEDVIALIEGK